MALLSVRITNPKPPPQRITDELQLNQILSGTIQTPGSSGGSTQSVLSDLRLSGSVNHQKFFLTVLSESDFDLIVDEIWDNMKKDKKGWETKSELRAGLLAFMQSLPGN